MQLAVLSKSQTATVLGVHLSTINRLIKSGKLPRIQLSDKRVGILKANIDAYLKNASNQIMVTGEGL